MINSIGKLRRVSGQGKSDHISLLGMDPSGSHRIRRGFYQQAVTLIGTEGLLVDAGTR